MHFILIFHFFIAILPLLQSQHMYKMLLKHSLTWIVLSGAFMCASALYWIRSCCFGVYECIWSRCMHKNICTQKSSSNCEWETNLQTIHTHTNQPPRCIFCFHLCICPVTITYLVWWEKTALAANIKELFHYQTAQYLFASLTVLKGHRFNQSNYFN